MLLDIILRFPDYELQRPEEHGHIHYFAPQGGY